TTEVAAVVEVMSVQPTSEKRTVRQLSGSAAFAAPPASITAAHSGHSFNARMSSASLGYRVSDAEHARRLPTSLVRIEAHGKTSQKLPAAADARAIRRWQRRASGHSPRRPLARRGSLDLPEGTGRLRRSAGTAAARPHQEPIGRRRIKEGRKMGDTVSRAARRRFLKLAGVGVAGAPLSDARLASRARVQAERLGEGEELAHQVGYKH